MNATGKVFLVGAGPGDLGLVTLRAKELITSCDVLVYDYLTNPALLDWTRPGCEHIDVGKRPHAHAISQEAIQALLIDRAQAGKSVLRLKGGDPLVFGRGGEEAESLVAAGLDFEMVPGVTAALGAAAYAGIPLTHREKASSVAFLTGHEDPTKQAVRVNFRQWAQYADTLCIYMGMGNLAFICAELIAGGLATHTPVAVIEWATLPKQRRLVGTLGNIAQAKESSGMEPPSVIIVGEAVQHAERLAWFPQGPLVGRRIAVTSNRARGSELAKRLLALGADVLELPLIEIEEAIDTETSTDILKTLHAYQWILFTSANGVHYFFEKFFRRFKDLRHFGGMRIACVGAATAEAVKRLHLQVDFIPEQAVASALAEGLLQLESLEHQAVLVITGNRNRKDLVEILEQQGQAIVDTLPVYKTTLKGVADCPAAERFRQEGADTITFSSASAVDGFAAEATNLQLAPNAQTPKAVSIGPMTSAHMKGRGIPVASEAKTHDLTGLIEALTIV